MFEMAPGFTGVQGSAGPRTGNTPSSQEQPKVRTEFPETWLWSESRTGYHLILGVIRAAKFGTPSMSKLFPFLCCHLMADFDRKFCIVVYFRQILKTLHCRHGRNQPWGTIPTQCTFRLTEHVKIILRCPVFDQNLYRCRFSSNISDPTSSAPHCL